MTIKINDLEIELNLQSYIKNEVSIPTDKGFVVYVGEAIGLHFGGMDDIKGEARLSKYIRTKETKIKKKFVRWFPPKFQTEEIPYVNEKKVWAVNSGLNYFIYDGESKTEYDHFSHKSILEERATSKGLNLSHKLFDMVFGPIDSKIMNMYKQARKED